LDTSHQGKTQQKSQGFHDSGFKGRKLEIRSGNFNEITAWNQHNGYSFAYLNFGFL